VKSYSLAGIAESLDKGISRTRKLQQEQEQEQKQEQEQG
jgi:hypothetical protein